MIKTGIRIILVLCIPIAIIGYFLSLAKPHTTTSYHFTLQASQPVTPTPTPTPQHLSRLIDAISDALDGSEGSYSIVVKNLQTGDTYIKEEQKSYTAGSLYKLWVMAETFRQIERGLLSEDDILSNSVATLNSEFGIAPENAELTSGTVTLSVKDALEQMITISHNYAAMLLVEKIQRENIQNFMNTFHFDHSTLGDPTTTAADVASFFEKLYHGDFCREPCTKGMIDLLKRQALDNKIPRLLPTPVEVAHKTGELYGFSHDAGIVYAPSGPYILVVLSESEYPAGAEDRIAAVSKRVYDYFEPKK
jgi:beta-lactamase class A